MSSVVVIKTTIIQGSKRRGLSAHKPTNNTTDVPTQRPENISIAREVKNKSGSKRRKSCLQTSLNPKSYVVAQRVTFSERNSKLNSCQCQNRCQLDEN